MKYIPFSETQVGLAFISEGIQKNDGEGIKWLRRAADNGCGDGRFFLACLYKHGHHGPPRGAVQALMGFELLAHSMQEWAQHRGVFIRRMTPTLSLLQTAGGPSATRQA